MKIIAGSLKGRALTAPKDLGTRPTAARVREALFSILGGVDGARVLDLYAGSGSLSFEALSRGAAHALLVEQAARACAAIRDNVARLGVTARVTLLAARVEAAGSRLREAGPFDLIFVDPPWADAQVASVELERLAHAGLFAESSRIVFSHSARAPLVIPPASALSARSARVWGDTALTFLEPRAD